MDLVLNKEGTSGFWNEEVDLEGWKGKKNVSLFENGEVNGGIPTVEKDVVYYEDIIVLEIKV